MVYPLKISSPRYSSASKSRARPPKNQVASRISSRVDTAEDSRPAKRVGWGRTE